MPLNNWLSVLRNKFSAPPRLCRRSLKRAVVFRAVEGYESRILLSATTTSSDGTDAVGPLQPDYATMLSMYSTAATTTGSVADQTATAYMGSLPNAGFGMNDLSGSATTAGTQLGPIVSPYSGQIDAAAAGFSTTAMSTWQGTQQPTSDPQFTTVASPGAGDAGSTSGASGTTDPWMAAFLGDGQASAANSAADASGATEQQSANDDDAATETAEGDASLPEPTVSGGFTTTTTVNGDATTTTYTLTSSISLESGSMAGGDPNDNSRWDIPTDWIDTASTIPEESDGSGSNADVTSEDAANAAATNESGVRFKASATITVSITTGPYTAPDGSTGTTTSVTFGFTGSVVIMVSGSWSTGDEGNTGTVLTAEDIASMGPADLEMPPSDAESSMTRIPRELILGGNGISVSASGEYFSYAYATLGFSVTVSNTTMDNDAPGGGLSAPSASLNLSLGSGRFSTDQSDIMVQESSESSSGSNSKSVQVKEENVSSSATSFALNLSSEDNAGEDAAGEGDGGSSDTISSSPFSAAFAPTGSPGNETAGESPVSAEEEDGPLSFSSSSFNSHQKTTLYGTQSSQQSESSDSSSSTNADIEDSSSGSTSLSFSINGFDYDTTSKNKSEFSFLSESQSSSDSPVGYDGRPSAHSEATSSHVIETLDESERTFGFGFGSDGLNVTNEYSSNDTVSDVLKSESTSGSWRLVYPTITSSLEMMTNPQSASPSWLAGPELEITTGHNIQFNYGGNLEDGFEGSSSQTAGYSSEFLKQDGTVGRSEYTLTVAETFPNTNDVPAQRTLESILNEYRDRATNIARWQAQLQTTTDPGMRDYLQGLINSEQSILSTIATNAINAGATEEQLNQISTEARAAAAGNPIELQTLENFNDAYDDSAAPGYFYFLFNPSAMDDDLENRFYVSLGVAGGALALAGGLAAFPVISEGVAAFAAAEFALPSFGGGGLVLAGIGSTSGAVIGGGTITGGEILGITGIAGSLWFAVDPNMPARQLLPGRLQREFPSEYMNSTLSEIKELIKTENGEVLKKLRKAKKILENIDRLMGKL